MSSRSRVFFLFMSRLGGRPRGRLGAGRFWAGRLAVTGVMVAGLLTAIGAVAPGAALAATGSGGLMAAPGQFFPVTPVKVLDTRNGTGGVTAAPLASGATATFTVTGMGDVPAAGDVSDVYGVINAISPQYSGCLNDYDADLSNPWICTVSFEPAQNMSDSDIVQVSSSGPGVGDERQRRADQYPETGLTLTHDQGITYGHAATFRFQPDPVHAPDLWVSVGVQTETEHTKATEQGV